MKINSSRLLQLLVIFFAAAVFLAIYLPDTGRGLLKDDFSWIFHSRIEKIGDAVQLFRQAQGFYRPLVALTFAGNYALFAMKPLGYGLTNLFLLLASAVALFFLARRLSLPKGSALLAGGLWLYNPHGISMALLWISGRTALLLTLFALLAAIAVLRRKPVPALLFFFMALLAKEDAVLLPGIFFLMAGIWTGETGLFSWRQAFSAIWYLIFPLALYFLLRGQTPAFLPLHAPVYYRFDFHPGHLLRNLLEYTNRASLLALVLAILLLLLLWRWPRWDKADRRRFFIGLLWLAGGFGLTVFLPVRSSLYAVFPSLGSSLAAAALVWTAWRNADWRAQRRTLLAVALLPFLLWPVYNRRNRRWTLPASTSSQLAQQLMRQAPAWRNATCLVLHDFSPSRRVLVEIYGTLVQDALRLYGHNPGIKVWLEPPAPDWQLSGLKPPSPGTPCQQLTFRNGRFVIGTQ